jgi:hypothetical protein
LGRLDEAEDEIRNFKQVVKTTSSWINPFNVEYQKKVFERKGEYLFVMPGALGKLMRFKRDWLVAMTAPFKRGKTFWLQEIAVEALFNKLKVVIFSLEMPDTQLSERLYKRLTALGDEDNFYLYPIWDCGRNQDDSCKKSERKGTGSLINRDGELLEYNQKVNHKPCTWCKDNNINDYVQASWFTSYRRNKIKLIDSIKATKGFKLMYGDNLRIISHPPNSVNSKIIERDLDVLEYSEEFIPDVIIVDYVDIMAAEDKGSIGVDKEDKAWISLERLSREKHCLVVTATQGTKESLEATNVRQKHTARWVGKLGHVDVMYVLNQTPMEKERMIMRIGTMLHRHEKFNERFQVRVLYQFDLGQVNLNSII